MNDDWQLQRAVERLVDGLTPDNAMERLALIVGQLGEMADSQDLRFLLHDPSGTLPDFQQQGRPSLASALLAGLAGALTRIASMPVQTEQVVKVLRSLPPQLQGRAIMWWVGPHGSADSSATVRELAEAIAARPPTGDDLEAIEWIVGCGGPEIYEQAWSESVGEPPDPEDLGEHIHRGDVPMAWRRSWLWVQVLPESVTPNWQTASAIMSTGFGSVTADHYRTRQPMGELYQVGSPLSADDLSGPPAEVARRIAAWRPNPSEYRVCARELGRTLQASVASDVDRWAGDPVAVAAILRHPTYIAHYFHGVAAGLKESRVDPGRVMEAVRFVRTHPYEVVPLGSDDFDYDPNWDDVDNATVEVIRSLAESGAGFGHEADTAWDILARSVRDTRQGSGIGGDQLDPMETALNRPCTRALDATLHLLGYEVRHGEGARADLLSLYDEVLAVPGRTGAEYRAVLASRLGFLLHVAGDWVNARSSLLMGNDAPDDLGPLTVRLAMRWGQPSRWLLERHRSDVFDAVASGEGRALDQVMLGMLWGWQGYGIHDVANALAGRSPALLSSAGERLARLLRDKDTAPELIAGGVLFWDEVLARGTGAALAGFGWWAEVRGIDREQWEALMLRTARLSKGIMEWAPQVVSRALEDDCSERGLEIASLLVPHIKEPWEKSRAAATATHALRTAKARLGSTDAYQALRTTLLTLGFHGAREA